MGLSEIFSAVAAWLTVLATRSGGGAHSRWRDATAACGGSVISGAGRTRGVARHPPAGFVDLDRGFRARSSSFWCTSV